MRKPLLATLFTLLPFTLVFSQTDSQTNEGFHRFEGYVGYSNAYLLHTPRNIVAITPFNTLTLVRQEWRTRLLKGFEVSGTANLQRYFGLKFDFSRHKDSRHEWFHVWPSRLEELPVTSSTKKVLGGFQLKDNAENRRIKPFVHVLVGTSKEDSFTPENVHELSTFLNPATLKPIPLSNLHFSVTSFSGAIGGGLDIKVSDRVDFRAIQMDYHQDNGGGGKTIRIGTGLVFH